MVNKNNFIKKNILLNKSSWNKKKLEIKKTYKDLKSLVDRTNLWLEKTSKENIANKIKDDYIKLKKQTDEILEKINELKIKIIEEGKNNGDKIQDLLNDGTGTIKEKKEQYKNELKNLYTELKKVAEKISLWLEKNKKIGIMTKIKNEYKTAKIEAQKLFDKVGEFKKALIDNEYIKILFNGEEIPVIFDKKSSCLIIGEDKYKLLKIVIGKGLKDDSIKILDFSIKKDKPVLSILIPSLIAKKYKLSKNHSKPFILEGIIKRSKIKETAKWLVLYGKGEFKLKMNGLDIIIKIKKI